MPLTVISFSNSSFSDGTQKSVERDQVFAHVGVDVQRDLGAGPGQIGECRHADGHVVADAGRFDDGLVGMLGQQLSAQMGDHIWANMLRTL